MEETQKKLVRELGILASKMADVCRALLQEDQLVENRSRVPRPEISEKIGKRVCLSCGTIVKIGETYRRGLCNACYVRTMDEIKAGSVTDAELVAAGMIAAKTKGGRPRAPERKFTALDEYIRSKSPEFQLETTSIKLQPISSDRLAEKMAADAEADQVDNPRPEKPAGAKRSAKKKKPRQS